MPQGRNVLVFSKEMRMYVPNEEQYYYFDDYKTLVREALQKASLYNVGIEFLFENNKEDNL